MVEAQLASALQALAKRDSDLAARVVAGDARVDELEQEVQQFTIRMLALRQPMAGDLREIVATLKIAADLAASDYTAKAAANMARLATALSAPPPISPPVSPPSETAQ